MKDNKAVTMIALVITIIVLLIMSGVAISSITGDNGVVSNAQKAEEQTRASQINEKINVFLHENLIGSYTGNMKTREEVIQELVDSGLLKQEEAEKLQTQDTIQIGDVIIDFSPLGTVSEDTIEGKTLYYNNTRFLIFRKENNAITAIATSFPDQNKYMLSPKYKIINDRKVSVALDDEDAVTDENLEEFSERISNELNNACSERFGRTGQNPITSTNCETNFFLPIYGLINQQTLDDIVERAREANNLLDMLQEMFEISDSQYEAYCNEFWNSNANRWYRSSGLMQIPIVFDTIDSSQLNQEELVEYNRYVEMISSEMAGINILEHDHEILETLKAIGNRMNEIVSTFERAYVLNKMIENRVSEFWMQGTVIYEYSVNTNRTYYYDPAGIKLAEKSDGSEESIPIPLNTYECCLFPVISFDRSLLVKNVDGTYSIQ